MFHTARSSSRSHSLLSPPRTPKSNRQRKRMDDQDEDIASPPISVGNFTVRIVKCPVHDYSESPHATRCQTWLTKFVMSVTLEELISLIIDTYVSFFAHDSESNRWYLRWVLTTRPRSARTSSAYAISSNWVLLTMSGLVLPTIDSSTVSVRISKTSSMPFRLLILSISKGSRIWPA